MGSDAPADFPAAHSMDTHWYAVDEDGHVAHFDSGEDGAVPLETRDQLEPDLEPSVLAAVLPGSRVIHDHVGRTGGAVVHLATWARHTVAVFLADRSPLQDRPVAFRRATTGVVGFSRELTDSDHGRLHRKGQCLSCVEHHSWHDEEPLRTQSGLPGRHAALGFFTYDHPFIRTPSPYERIALPEVPIKARQLPEAALRVAERIRFRGVCFARLPRLQPLERVASRCYGRESEWRDESGALRLPDAT